MNSEIKQSVLEIVQRKSGIHIDECITNSNQSLFFDPFNLSYIDLLSLYFELKERWHLKFVEDDLANETFLTIDRITQLIEFKLK